MSTVEGPAIDEIAARIPAHVAQLAVAKAFAQIGSEAEWDSATIERVMFHLDAALYATGVGDDIPSPYSLDDYAIEFWAARLANQ